MPSGDWPRVDPKRRKLQVKIINKTNWDTNSLKRVLIKALNEDDKVEGKYGYRNGLKITIVYSKGGHPDWVVRRYKKEGKELSPRELYSGYAWVGGSGMRLRVPREIFNVRRFVKLFIHEMSHIRGIRSHRAIGRVKDKDLEWAKNYSVEQKEVEIKPKADLQLKRYEHVLAALKDKKSKLKRLQNQIKKWTQKKRYYEHVLIANGKIKKEEN